MERTWVQLLVMALSAALEVGGDAMIRAGLRGAGRFMVVIGFLTLGSYGILVNQLPVDFSKLLGVYVGVFAVSGVLLGRFYFGEVPPVSTWIGLGVVFAGSMIIQFGQSR